MYDGDEAIGFKPTTLASNIPTELIHQTIHRLLLALDESTLGGKHKAYGDS